MVSDFADKSFDYVVCFQALNAYGRPRRWLRFVQEMKRIARTAVLVIPNPFNNRLDQRHIRFTKALAQSHAGSILQVCPDTQLPAVRVSL